MPYFGFKAKHKKGPGNHGYHCTVPYFGFKAKHIKGTGESWIHCTVPYFGFKAKLFFELYDKS